MDNAVRDLTDSDRPAWLKLWAGYQKFYGISLPDEVTTTTWRRLLDPQEPIRAFVVNNETTVIGFAHIIFHRSTWSVGNTCYLQDLFVEPAYRRKGAARALIDAVYAHADGNGGRQVYWLTHHSNADGRRLYDKVAANAGFLLYERFA